MVPPEVLRLGAKAAGAVERGGRITLELEGQAPFEGDAVVGADGLRSTMRALIHDDRARFSGKVACRVLVPAGDVPELVEPPTLRMWLGPGGHLVSYPVSGGRFLTLAAALSAKDVDQESWTREGEVEEMREALRGWDPVVHAILGAAKKTLRLPLYDRAPVARMGRGRLTLLGDAAHPMLPFFAQGAAQAIEDACVLARCIAGAAASDLPDRLRRYEALRSSRAAEVQRRSTRNGWLFQLPNGVRQWARDLALGRLTLASFGWLYRYDAEALPLS
jgi:salicylate hydroxylase